MITILQKAAFLLGIFLIFSVRSFSQDTMPSVKVVGNRFVDGKGRTLVFQGVSISDPDKIVKNGHWGKEHFQVIKDWGANVVRIPVHPAAWRERGEKEYLKLLDQAVQWCTELKLYVIMDWHSIGNLYTELFQDPMYITTRKETFEFWRSIAKHYKDNPTVALYEIFNEPTSYRGELGKISWSKWREMNEEYIAVIRAYNPKAIPLIAGFDWAYDLTPLREEPVNVEGVAYVTHPYPFKRTRPWEPKWEEAFGFAADKYPVIATELGYEKGLEGYENDEYGKRIINYFHQKGISWVAWDFDPDWGPQLIRDWKYTPTESGSFFRSVMLGKYSYDKL